MFSCKLSLPFPLVPPGAAGELLFEFDQTLIGTLRQTPIFKECSLANLAYPFPLVPPDTAGELLFEFD